MKPLPCLLLAALPLAAAAQTPTADSATYRHQLGLTASPVLDGFFKNNRSLPLGLLYKRQVKPNQAWRVGAVLNQRYDQRYNPQPLTNRAFSNTTLGVDIYAGREWQQPFTSRWTGYAGLDAGVGYNYYRTREDSERFATIDGVDVILLVNDDTRYTTLSAFLRPLMGIRYQIQRYLYLSAETTLSLSYSNLKWKSTGSVIRKDNGELNATELGTYQENHFRTVLRPISQITMHYCFGSTSR